MTGRNPSRWNKIKAARNKMQIRRNKMKAGRNKIQINNRKPSLDIVLGFSIGYRDILS
jgi:hypothetical protein